MTAKPRIALIIGSTRPKRFADTPAQWMLKQARARDDMEVELIDLRDHPMPFFDEAMSNLWAPSENPEAIRWQQTVGRFDGYIFVVAEYNHSITAVLKNALDQAYINWNKKPFSAVGYGAVGGTRAVEHLRTIGIELQMVPTRSAVHIGGADFFAVHPLGGQNKSMTDIEGSIASGATDMLNQIVWWGKITKAQREADAAAQ